VNDCSALTRSVTYQSVDIDAPARLHLGFLDLNGGLGRKYGSIGLAVNTHSTAMRFTFGDTFQVTGVDAASPNAQRISALCEQFFSSLGQHVDQASAAPQIEVSALIPEHAGLGSGTQLAITVGTGLCKLYGIEATTADIAFAMGRGKRSGIGINTFDLGGFVVDGGLTEQSSTPPVLSRMHFPEEWRIIMVMDPQQQGVHGEQEQIAFRDLPTFPKSSSQQICHLTLMQLLPALAEKNIDDFGHAVTEIQGLIGQHFSPYQGGQFSSDRVGKLLGFAQQAGHKGIAQSSWGPTGCIFVKDQSTAEQLQKALLRHAEAELSEAEDLTITIATANNTGASIHYTNT